MTDDDTPRPPPLPLDATAWEAEAHRVDMHYWEACRQARLGGRTFDMTREEFAGLLAMDEGLEPPVNTTDNPFLGSCIDWADLFDADHQAAEWLLEPIFARGRAHAIYAAAKAGKSFIVLAAAAALASGRAFLAKPASQPISVLYCDYEQTPDDLRDRLTDFGYKPDELANLHYALLPPARPLDTPEGAQELLEAALAVAAELVVIDTTSRAVKGEENDADTFRDFYRLTGLALKARGITWVRLDHSGKTLEAGQRGSSAKNDDVDVVWRIEKVDGGRSLVATHRRMNWVPEKIVLKVDEREDGIWTIDSPETQDSWPAGTKEVAADLERLGVAVDASTTVASNALKAAGLSRRRRVVLAGVKWRRREQEFTGTTVPIMRGFPGSVERTEPL